MILDRCDFEYMVVALYVDRNSSNGAYTDEESDMINMAIDKYYPIAFNNEVNVDVCDVCEMIRKCIGSVEHWKYEKEKCKYEIHGK